MTATVGVLASRIRVEEKLVLAALERRGARVEVLDPRTLVLPAGGPHPGPGAPAAGERIAELDVVLDRSIAYGHSLYALRLLELAGVPCVNRAEVVAVCGDKARTSAALAAAGVPTPETRVAFTPEAGLEALEELGYPAVVKPVVGSWGRLVARVPDAETARALFEHKETLGGWQQHVLYLQRLVAKPGRDVRAFVVGDRCVAAIYRASSSWITNTARGATVSACPVTPAIEALAVAAARAVGGGALAVDLVEDPDDELLVLEVNHSMEFRNSVAPTGVDIPGAVVDHALASVRAVVA